MTSAALPEPGQLFGRYQLDSVIGRGGMGVVFLATDPQLKRRVAVKVVGAQLGGAEGDYLRRFAREAETMARVRSSHIVAIYDYGTDAGRPYLVSEYIPGGDLARRLVHGALPPGQAVDITAQLASALSAAHRAGVLHRDVKPSNILLDHDGVELRAVLCDFGIAQPEDAESITKAGGVTGSTSYLSPERLNGLAATPAADIYGAGCVLWACLTGHAPYQGSDTQVAMAHVSAPVPQLHGGDPETQRLNRILGRALAKDPRQRYTSAQELREDLLRKDLPPAPAQPQVTMPSRRPTPPGPRRRGRLALLAAGGVVLLGAAGTGTALLLHGHGNDSNHHSTNASAPAKPKHAVPGDLNGDGKGDIGFTLQGAGDTKQRVTATSSGTSYGAGVARSWDSTGSFAGQILGDARSDLLEVHAYGTPGGGSAVRLRAIDHGNGPARTTTVRGQSSWHGDFFDFAGDYDGDGHVDVALSITAGNTFEIWVMRGTSTGVAAPTKWFSSPGWTVAHNRLESGDFDGDGKTDLSARVDPNGTTPAVDLLQSTGSSFALSRAPSNLKIQSTSSDDLAGDFDGDGHADQLVLFTDKNSLHQARLGQWSRSGFAASSNWRDAFVPLAQNDKIGAQDIDGDGRADLVILHPLGGGRFQVSWQRSTGTTLDGPKVLTTYASQLPKAEAAGVQDVF